MPLCGVFVGAVPVLVMLNSGEPQSLWWLFFSVPMSLGCFIVWLTAWRFGWFWIREPGEGLVAFCRSVFNVKNATIK